jgi:tetratricopeptide (TPR) repeat protein
MSVSAPRAARRSSSFTHCAAPPRRAAVLASGLALAVALGAPGCRESDPIEEVKALHARGQYAASLEPLRALLEERPDELEVHYLYGFALTRLGQPSLAQWSLRKAMQSEAWRVPAAYQLAAGELAIGNNESAIDVLGQILEEQPDDLDALTMRSSAWARTRRHYAEALADADRVRELDPENTRVLAPRIVALLGLQRIDEAAAAIDEIEQKVGAESLGAENRARYCVARATFEREKGELERATERMEACATEFPLDPLVVAEAVELFDARRQPERSEAILRKALELEPRASGYRISLAARLRADGRIDEAERLLLEATGFEPKEAAAVGWLDLGKHYQELGRHEDSALAVDRAVALLSEPSPQVLFEYADALILAGRLDDALEVARDMTVEPHRDLVRARVAMERGQPAEALEHFTAAFRLWPNNAIARYYAALAAEQLSDFDRAVDEYRYAVRADPGATPARLRLARLHLAEDDPVAALQAARASPTRGLVDLEAELLSLRALVQAGRVAEAQSLLAQVPAPATGQAVAALASALAEARGPEPALRWLRNLERLDLTAPRNAPALRVLVELLVQTGRPEEGLAAAERAVAAHPDVAALHAIRGSALAGVGGREEEARAAFERARASDPEHAPAVYGLAQWAAVAGDAEQAAALYTRAAELQAGDPEEASRGHREAAAQRVSQGRTAEAEAQLALALAAHPYDPEAAGDLAGLRLSRETSASDETLALARRAVRFGGGDAAKSLLARVERSRDAAAPPAATPR